MFKDVQDSRLRESLDLRKPNKYLGSGESIHRTMCYLRKPEPVAFNKSRYALLVRETSVQISF